MRRKSKKSNKPLLNRFNWTKIIAWLIIGLVTYTIWFKMVPAAVEYVR